MKRQTLSEILKTENEKRMESGAFGIAACKESIQSRLEWDKQSTLYTQLEEYVRKANTDVFFNKAMVLACWELMND